MMTKENIEILAFKIQSSDTDDTIKKFVAYSQNCIVLVYDCEKISIRYVGPGIHFKGTSFKFNRIENKKLNRLFLPFLFVLDLFCMIKVFKQIFKNYHPNVCWVENVFATCIIGFFKLFHSCEKIVYIPGDWLVNWSIKSPYSYIANNLFYPIVDYIACKMSDLVFSAGEKLLEERIKKYGVGVIKKEFVYSPLAFPGTSVQAANTREKNKAICFIGDLRLDSGLDIAIQSLKELRKLRNIIIKIIGHKTVNYEYFKNMVIKYDVENYVSFLGHVDHSGLKDALSDCFCGINILTNIKSFSSYVIPGKQIYYLQFLLPIVTTRGGGILTPDIERKKLGAIIEPTPNDFCSTIPVIYDNQATYRKNILDYLSSIKHIELEDVFKTMVS